MTSDRRAAVVVLAYKLTRDPRYAGWTVTIRGSRRVPALTGTLLEATGAGRTVNRIPRWVDLTLEDGRTRRVPWWKAVHALD